MYCSRCGTEISATTVFCPMCGQSVSGLTPAAAAPVVYAGPFYAGFWLRFVALLIDTFCQGCILIILIIPVVILSGAGALLSRVGSGDDISDDVATLVGLGFVGAFVLVTLLIGWLYYALSESSSWQGTIGKKLLGLYVTDISGQPVSFGRASGRYFARIVTRLIPLCIGYIMAGFTEKKQAVHDMIASCLVLRKN